MAPGSLHIHDLRRTLGSWLASGVTNLPILGRVMNHKAREVNKVYARLTRTPARNAMKVVASGMTQPPRRLPLIWASVGGRISTTMRGGSSAGFGRGADVGPMTEGRPKLAVASACGNNSHGVLSGR